jgi:hypothetical protein
MKVAKQEARGESKGSESQGFEWKGSWIDNQCLQERRRRKK